MQAWECYTQHKQPHEHSVTGELQRLPSLYSPQLDNYRDLLVLLPPSYNEQQSRRYPVLYMHDGQNLFDFATSFSREWYVDETMYRYMAAEGIEAIIVGIPNTPSRIDEYSPWISKQLGGGCGDLYLDFVVSTIKPLIDADFRTLKGRKHTGIMGSSMGGLISLYALMKRPQTFGFAGAMSPSVWFANRAIVHLIEGMERLPDCRLYLDGGHHEMNERFNKYYLQSMRWLRDVLVDKGYKLDDALMYVEDEHGHHNEDSWARRFPEAMRFLFRSNRAQG